MSGLTKLPKRGPGEDLGPTKYNKPGVPLGSNRRYYAGEHNTITLSIEEVCESVGLGDGSTVGSLMELIRGDTKLQADESTGTITLTAGGTEIGTIKDGELELRFDGPASGNAYTRQHAGANVLGGDLAQISQFIIGLITGNALVDWSMSGSEGDAGEQETAYWHAIVDPANALGGTSKVEVRRGVSGDVTAEMTAETDAGPSLLSRVRVDKNGAYVEAFGSGRIDLLDATANALPAGDASVLASIARLDSGPDLDSGTWSPAIDTFAGDVTGATLLGAHYLRVGDIISWSVKVSVTHDVGGTGTFLMDPPPGIVSLTDANQAFGVGGDSGYQFGIRATSPSARLTVQSNSASGSTHTAVMTGTAQVL